MPVNDVQLWLLKCSRFFVLNITNDHCELHKLDQFGLSASTFVLSEILQAVNQLMISNHFRYHSKPYWV